MEQINKVIAEFNPKQRPIIEKWVNERNANGFGHPGTRVRLYTLKFIGQALGDMKFEDAKKEDIIRVLETKLKNLRGKEVNLNSLYYKKTIKFFYKWLHGTEGYPEIVSWIKLKRTIDETPEEHKALTDEEVKAILDATTNQRDRTIFMILTENPTRPKDICNLKIKHVVADEYGFELKLGSKTPKGRRVIRLINSVPDMRQHLANHPFKDDPDAPLFCQNSLTKSGKPIKWCNMSYALKCAVKTAKIKRKVTLYDFRRTSTTNLLRDSNYSPGEIQKMGGWASIRMLDIYGQVTSEMVNKKKLAINGLIDIKEIEKKKDMLKPIECPRCHERNSPSAITCGTCWLPLKKQAIDLKEKVIMKSIEWQKPLSKDLVKEVLKELIKDGEIKI